jgi:hypothetical protein
MMLIPLTFTETAPTTNSTQAPTRKYLKCMFCVDVDTVDSCIEERFCAPDQVKHNTNLGPL